MTGAAPSEAVMIVNPRSGGGRGARALRAALPLLARHAITPHVVICRDGSDPGRAAAQAVADGAALVIAVGGDGHAAAVAGGLVGSQTALAVLPAGSANDYAGTLGLARRDVGRAVNEIAARRTERLDTVRVANRDGERYFLNVVGTGFDAVVAITAERIRVLRGAGRYVVAVMRELPRFSAATLRLSIDGQPLEQRAMLVVLANGPTYGGGMRIAPDARLDSGWLELCIVGDVGRLGFARAFPRVFRGTHVTHRAVTMLRAKEVVLDADRPFGVLGDGELFGGLPATISIMPASLSVVVGPDFRRSAP